MAPDIGLDLRVDRHSDLPLGAQLAASLRGHIARGTLPQGERLPSVRELAAATGVNVNTARAVYGRLEREGLVRSEQGRGTFVAAPGDAVTRQELRRQIAALEAELVRRPPLPGQAQAMGRPQGGRLPSTEELREIRDRLLERLRELDDQRAEVLRRIAELDLAEAAPAPSAEPVRRSSTSLRGARVRWVGA